MSLWWYAKCYDCLLTHWLLMTSILFLTDTIYSNKLRNNYLTKKNFLEIFFAFSKFRFHFEHFQNKDDPHNWCTFELVDPEKHEKRLFQTELSSQASRNMVKVLSFSFEQCLAQLIELLLEGSSETGLFKHLSTDVFRNS